MYARLIPFLTVAALILGVAYVGLAPVSATTAVSSPRPVAATPRWAVLRVIRPFYDRSAQNNACNPVSGRIAACPLTPRLRAALVRELQWELAHTRGGNVNFFCRCQNIPRRVIVSGVKPPYFNAAGRFAEVDTIWYWSTKPVNISWITRRVPGGWQVDNGFCAGSSLKTDLYHIPVGPCPAT